LFYSLETALFIGGLELVERIYLDHAATTPLDERVLEEMLPFLKGKFGNASSLHALGTEARKAVESAREKIAKAINAGPEEIYFTSGGTESDNIALQGIAHANKEKGKHIISTKIEHHAVLETLEHLEKEGFEVTFLPVSKEGIVKVKDVENAIREDTVLISVMHANNEIGTIQPVEAIAKIAKKRGIFFHSDAVQTIGKLAVDVKKMGVDALAGSAHKFYGPKGIGFMYLRKGINVKPIMFGGGQEKKLRSGTENVAGIVGMGKAIELAVKEMPMAVKKEVRLRDKIIKEALKIGESWLNGGKETRICNNANFGFKHIEGEALVIKLDDKGIAASTGSACSSKELKPSHVLLAIGLKPWEAHGSLRLTVGKENTSEEIDIALNALEKVVKDLRKISPLTGGN